MDWILQLSFWQWIGVLTALFIIFGSFSSAMESFGSGVAKALRKKEKKDE